MDNSNNTSREGKSGNWFKVILLFTLAMAAVLAGLNWMITHLL